MNLNVIGFADRVEYSGLKRNVLKLGCEDEFLKELTGHAQQAAETGRNLKKKLKALPARDDGLDGLFERIYEDNGSIYIVTFQ